MAFKGMDKGKNRWPGAVSIKWLKILGMGLIRSKEELPASYHNLFMQSLHGDCNTLQD